VRAKTIVANRLTTNDLDLQQSYENKNQLVSN